MNPLDALTTELKEIFGARLIMLAAFGADGHACAIVQSVTVDDLDRCAARRKSWRKLGLDTPLFVVERELPRAIDAFPLELTEIIATRRVLVGDDLLASIAVPKEDLRRACEVQARGHVVHLREAYMESGGDPREVNALVAAAVAPFRGLVTNVARLDGMSPKALVTQLALENFEKGFPEALRAAERIVEYVDGWKH